MNLKPPHDAAYHLSCRSAFTLFKEHGLAEVIKQFPECVDFVLEHQDKELNDVTEMIQMELDKLRN